MVMLIPCKKTPYCPMTLTKIQVKVGKTFIENSYNGDVNSLLTEGILFNELDNDEGQGWQNICNGKAIVVM